MTTGWRLAFLICLSACASQGSAPEPEVLYGGLHGCETEEFPAELPSPGALLDTASLTRALVGVTADSTRSDSAGVSLTLWYQPDGVNIRRDVIGHTVTPVVADSVQQLVFANLERAAERERPWGVRLDVGLGDRVTYDVERREYCPPRPRDQELEDAMERVAVLGSFGGAGARERVVLLRVTVHPVGYVADAEVVRGAGSGGSLEQDLVDFIRQYSFEPARLDGIPTYGEVVVPVSVRN